MSNTDYKQINWKQGMSVSSAHFIATENFLLERVLKNSALLQNRFSYGLLPIDSDSDSSLALSVVGTNEYAKLVLNSYHGVTQGGYLIDFDSDNDAVSCPCEVDGVASEEGWDVVLSVSPFDRNPCGEPNMQENPPRYPFVAPTYKLFIVARDKSHVNQYGPYDVVVGFLRKKDSSYKLDPSYIPPSLSMRSDDLLKSTMKSFAKSFATIKNSMDMIMEKAYVQAENNNRTSVMVNILEVCKELQRTLSAVSFKWHNYGMSLSPYQVVEIVSGLANAVSTSLIFFKKTDKEEILKYFYEWNGIQPSAFEQVMADLTVAEFQQNRISDSLTLAQKVLKTLEDLFVSLSRLDYVGQHKESIVIGVKETEKTSNNKTSWLEL